MRLSGERVCGFCQQRACTCGRDQRVPVELLSWWWMIETQFGEYVSLEPGVAAGRLALDDVVEIFGFANTPTDARGIVELRDGRWAYMKASLLEQTRPHPVVFRFAATFELLWWWACDDGDRAVLEPFLTPEQLDHELVRLDQMLAWPDEAIQRIAAARMSQRRR